MKALEKLTNSISGKGGMEICGGNGSGTWIDLEPRLIIQWSHIHLHCEKEQIININLLEVSSFSKQSNATKLVRIVIV